MEEDKKVSDQKVEPIKKEEEPEEAEKPVKSNKYFKIGLAVLCVLGAFVILGALISPVLLKAINPAEKIKKAQMEATATITPKLTSIPTFAPTKAFTTPTLAPTSTPVPVANSSLTVGASQSSGPTAVTVQNLSTNKVTTGGTETYQLVPGTYRVSVADKPGYKTGFSKCSSNCSSNSGNYTTSSWGNFAILQINADTPGAVFFYFISEDSLPHCAGGTDSPTCN